MCPMSGDRQPREFFFQAASSKSSCCAWVWSSRALTPSTARLMGIRSLNQRHRPKRPGRRCWARPKMQPTMRYASTPRVHPHHRPGHL